MIGKCKVRRTNFAARRPVRGGMTLLELLLALSLTGMVFVAIGMAIDLHLRSIDIGRTETEEAQLARALLRRMADDLRAAVQYQVIDFSSLQSVAPGGTEDLGDLPLEDNPSDGDGDFENGEQGAGEDPTGGFLPGEDAAPSASQDIAATAAPAAVPGVYGNQYELQIDVSRLPRPDEYQGVMALDAGASPLQIPSDVKTVSYFLRPPDDAQAAAPTTQGGFADEAPQGGLVRRELDRAVARLASDSGDGALLDATGDVLAPEVTGLEFRYFDGTQWLFDWDSDAMGGLPAAVEIAIAITPRRFLESDENSLLGGGADEPFPGEVVYRMVVRLPAAKPAPATPVEELAL